MGKAFWYDVDEIYAAWSAYLRANSKAKYFGMVYDPTKVAKFPYANFSLISKPTSQSTLQNDESSVNITIETEAYINNTAYMTLYNIDDASANFFIELGFRRVGESQPVKASDTVTKLTSRFYLPNYTGYYLKELETE